MAAAIEEQVAGLKATIQGMREQLRALGEPYEMHRTQGADLRKRAVPVIVRLAKAGVPQVTIADAFRVTRETIRRTELDPAHGINRDDVIAQADVLNEEQIAHKLGELRDLGEPYEEHRNAANELRRQAVPIVVALARAGVGQGELAEDFRVTRETIRRIEMEYEIDRGDARARVGSRAGRHIRRVASGSADVPIEESPDPELETE